MGMRVLLTSYTHSAVDNVLFKLLDLNLKFLRLGNEEKIHPKLHAHTLRQFTSVASLSGSFMRVHFFLFLFLKRILFFFFDFLEGLAGMKVVATTCFGTSELVVQKLEFDYCIIDEASQISLPVALGPLFCAKRFVLVGDHYQVISQNFVKKKLKNSSF
jgi:DNA replication ATP-dependent helicase Dna2